MEQNLKPLNCSKRIVDDLICIHYGTHEWCQSHKGGCKIFEPGDFVRERLQQLDAGEEFEEGSLLDQLLRSPHKIYWILGREQSRTDGIMISEIIFIDDCWLEHRTSTWRTCPRQWRTSCWQGWPPLHTLFHCIWMVIIYQVHIVIWMVAIYS